MRHLTIVLAAAALAACGQSEPAQTSTSAAAAPPSAEEKQAMLAALPAPYNSADLANGEAQFALCRSCHTIAPGGANMTGPNLHGVFGRKSASVEGFKYSDALASAGWAWDAAKLDQWLDQPKTFLPGTKMSFAGLHDAKDRTDLIAYLQVETR
jgi:cytochrome c